MIDVDSLKARLDLPAIVGHYVPLQKRGREFVGRCVWHSPDEHPSMWVTAKGFVHCFSCGASADAIAFVQHVEGCDFQKACELLGARDDWQPTFTPVPVNRPDRITSAPPLGTQAPDMTIRGLGRPVKAWCYRDSEGLPLGYVARYETEAGKEIRCWTWGARGDDAPAWGCGHWNKPRPLYGLDRLTAKSTASVLIVEGEKAADAAAHLLPAYAVVSWPGGAMAWDRADLAPLRGRSVLLWPDADPPGRECMERLAYVLSDPAGLACKVAVLDTAGEPEGRDAADWLDDGKTGSDVIAWARPRKRAYERGEPAKPAIAQDALQANMGGDEPPPPDDMPPPSSYEPAMLQPAQQPEPAPARRRPNLGLVRTDGSVVPALQDDPLPLELSESGIADEFAGANQADLRFVPEWRRRGWLVWTGARWRREDGRATPMQRMRLLSHTLKYRAAAAAMQPGGKNRLESKQYCGNVLDFAESDRRVLATPQQWDADPFVLGVPGGAVNLRTGDLIDALPEHYITRQTTVAPVQGDTPLFDRVIAQAVDGDAAMLDYLWRWLGYCLTGDVREEAFLFLYGPPACGKTTLIEAVAAILGSVHEGGYAVKTTMDLFIESKFERGAGKLHILHGARFAHAAETEEGRHWKPAMVKEATGGDTLIGERKYENEYSFRPTHKLLIHGNHRPHMRQADEGLRRRMQIVEYHAAVAEADRDLTLKQRLVAEYPAILFRMIAACLDWQREGLKPPTAVVQAVEDYYDAEDSFGDWLGTCITRKANARLSSTGAYHAYRSWLEERNEHAPSHKRFSGLMQSRGFAIVKSHGARFFKDAELTLSALPSIPDDWLDR